MVKPNKFDFEGFLKIIYPNRKFLVISSICNTSHLVNDWIETSDETVQQFQTDEVYRNI